MRTRVTAILVAHDGAEYLTTTIEALRQQTRAPDAVLTVDLGSRDSTPQLLADFGPTHYLSAPSSLTFGQAVDAAVRVAAPPASDDEWLWFLGADNAPEPDALAELLAAVEVAPSVAVAGPKQMEDSNSGRIHEFGETITTLGASVPIVDSELDQAQHDHLSDVLAVAAGGMLVRHSLWIELGGFDAGLPVVDDALDFCVRTRLAGHRVQLVPAARVSSAGERAPGTARLGAKSSRRKRRRLARTAQLHRRLAYAPAPSVPFHWLSLVPLAFLRSLMQLLRKQPTAVPGEIAAAFAVAFSGRRVSDARRRVARNKSVGWASIEPLRQPLAEGRRRRMLAREQYRAIHHGHLEGMQFFATGGAWTVLAAVVLGAVLTAPLLGAIALTGGPLLPLSSSVSELWSHVGYGFREAGIGIVGPADPFAYVLAVLGSITFWNPSSSIVYVFVAALPLAALASWLCASRVTERGWLRALAALLWTFSPTFLAALESGRVSAVLTHLLLPWLFFAGLVAARSWSGSAVAALLLAATGATSPSLVPALLVIWLVALLSSGKRLGRLIAVPLPLLALFAPIVWYQGSRNNWLALLADPGAPASFDAAPAWMLALGFPRDGIGHWDGILSGGVPPSLNGVGLVSVLLAPLVFLALGSLFLRGARRAAFALGTAVLGFVTAVLVSRVSVTVVGPDAIAIWPGAALSLAWLGLVGAVVFALAALGRYAIAPALVSAGALTVVVIPLLLAPAFGTSVVRPGDGRTLPAYVTAEAGTRSGIGTLVLVPTRDGGLHATLERGTGPVLDNQTTLVQTATRLSDADEELGMLAANLASRSGFDASTRLSELQVGFVLLEPGPPADGGDPQAAAETAARTSAALDENAILTRVGDTTTGVLWRVPTVNDAEDAVAPPTEPDNLDTAIGVAVLGSQGLIFGLTLLLVIPTGGLAASGRPLPEVRRTRVDTDTGDESDAPRPGDEDRVLVDSYVDEPTGESVGSEEIGDIPQPNDDVPSAEEAPAEKDPPTEAEENATVGAYRSGTDGSRGNDV